MSRELSNSFRLLRQLLLLSCLALLAACANDAEPTITPPQPQWVPNAVIGSPVDQGFYADYDPSVDGIWMEWYADTTHKTTGYRLFRSMAPDVDADGQFVQDSLVATFETSNEVQDPLPTSYRDTMGIAVGGVYYYQLQAFHRAPNGDVTYSPRTPASLAASFRFEDPVEPIAPVDNVPMPDIGITFTWSDDARRSGPYQLIVQREDTHGYPISTIVTGFSSQQSYWDSTKVLQPGVPYRWRVKRVDISRPGGYSSPWTSFEAQ